MLTLFREINNTQNTTPYSYKLLKKENELQYKLCYLLNVTSHYYVTLWNFIEEHFTICWIQSNKFNKHRTINNKENMLLGKYGSKFERVQK